jgi:uncharacterized protein HemY
MEVFLEFPSKTTYNSVHRYCGLKLEHTKSFLELSCHFNVVSTVSILVVIFGITLVLPHVTKMSEVFLPML